MKQPNPNTYGRYRDETAARRMDGWLRLHHQALTVEERAAGRWVAIRLSDGDSDGVVYDTRQDAMNHQFHPLMCLYHKIGLGEAPGPAACDVLLWYTRLAYDNGNRPDVSNHVYVPTDLETLNVYRSGRN